MKALVRNSHPRIFAALTALLLAFAQGGAHAQGAAALSQPQLDQMLAPIALYPDPLLSQILMAATYPPEVLEAARWSRARPGLSGEDAVRAAEDKDWDPSVKSLLAFPQVLARMGENPQWTQALGDAFLDHQSELMDSVQSLRRRAAAAGNLRSDDRLNVVEDGSDLLLQPFDPQLVYIPYYDPQIVYGTWWWPAYQPMYFRPWPGYYARPAYAGGFYWGPPVSVSTGFLFGGFDWPRRQVGVARFSNDSYQHRTSVNRAAGVSPAYGVWQHEAEHRRGIAYHGIEVQQRFEAPNAAQNQGNRARPADPQRSELRAGIRTTARAATPADASMNDRHGDTRTLVHTQAAAPLAPPQGHATVLQAPEARFDRRHDSPAVAHPAPAAPNLPAPASAQSAALARAPRAASPAPVLQPAAAAHPAPTAPPAARADRPSAGQTPGTPHDAQRRTKQGF